VPVGECGHSPACVVRASAAALAFIVHKRQIRGGEPRLWRAARGIRRDRWRGRARPLLRLLLERHLQRQRRLHQNVHDCSGW
jgi:hypothetical protein